MDATWEWSGLLVEERSKELPLRQDLDEVLNAEHLSEDRIGEHSRIDRILSAMCGGGSDLVADEVRDVDARAHPIVDLVS